MSRPISNISSSVNNTASQMCLENARFHWTGERIDRSNCRSRMTPVQVYLSTVSNKNKHIHH